MTKTYVAGPMTGLPDFNRKAFLEAREMLEAADHEVVDPVTEDVKAYGSWEAAIERPWQEHLARDISIVPTCDDVAVLPGWETSSGADIEVRIARALKMPVFELSYDGPRVVLHRLSDEDLSAILARRDVASSPPLEATERSRASSDASNVVDLGFDASAGAQNVRVDSVDITFQDPYDGDRFVPYAEDPKRHVFGTGGIKDNKGKAPIDLLPSRPLVAVAEVLAFGAVKYQPHNWRKGLPWPDTYSSLQRHLLAWNDGEDLDPETGKSHLAHAGCQLMFLLDYVLSDVGAETDTRWRPKIEVEVPEVQGHASARRCLKAGCPTCKNPAA